MLFNKKYNKATIHLLEESLNVKSTYFTGCVSRILPTQSADGSRGLCSHDRVPQDRVPETTSNGCIHKPRRALLTLQKTFEITNKQHHLQRNLQSIHPRQNYRAYKHNVHRHAITDTNLHAYTHRYTHLATQMSAYMLT